MTSPALLTRAIGQTERSLRALLDRKLEAAGLSFAEWTTLVVLDAELLTAEQIVERQLAGRVVEEPRAGADVVGALHARGLLGPVDAADRFALTAEGRTLYEPLRDAVRRTVHTLFADLPTEDLEAAHRTLAEVMRRAREELS